MRNTKGKAEATAPQSVSVPNDLPWRVHAWIALLAGQAGEGSRHAGGRLVQVRSMQHLLTLRNMSVSSASSGCSSDSLQPVQCCGSSATLAPSGRRSAGASRCVSLVSACAASHSAWPQAAQHRWRRRAARPRAHSSRQQLDSATAGHGRRGRQHRCHFMTAWPCCRRGEPPSSHALVQQES